MSLFGSLDKSTGAQFHLKTGSRHLSQQVNRSMRAPESRTCRINTRFFPRRQRRPAIGSIADIFINSLVIAGYCKHHAPYNRGVSRSFSTALGSAPEENSPQPERQARTKSASIENKMRTSHINSEYEKTARLRRNADAATAKPSKRKSKADGSQQKEEKLHYVPLLNEKKTQRDPSSDIGAYQQILDAHPNYQDSRNLFNFYLGALGEVEAKKSIQAVLSNKNKEIFLSSRRNTRCLRDTIEIPEVEHLVTLLQEDKVDNQAIFKAYKDLPSPGVSYLSENSRGRLLHRFADPPKRRYIDARRYLAIFQDMNDAELHMSVSLWTTAIYLTGRSSANTSRVDLKDALGIWRRMEHEAEIPSTSVTFNILFDIAIKAGQYVVADSLLQEMGKRGIELSRCGRVTQIYLCGLRQDAAGIYQAYNNLVQAGEIVDTVVLNCVMASLIRAGEYDAAKRMYDRMKDVHEKTLSHAPSHRLLSRYTSPPTNFSAYRKASKRFGRLLGASAYLSKTHPDHHRTLQAAVPLTPDSRTFHTFLSHHSYHSGDLESFMAMVDDMEKTFSLPPQGMVYIFLFEGFARHGGAKQNIWTYERLRAAWASFLRALHESKEKEAADRRTILRRQKMEWENPSKNTKVPTADTSVLKEKLPSFNFSSTDPRRSYIHERTGFSKEENDIEEDFELDDGYGYTNSRDPIHHDGNDMIDFKESENGVYLGRRIVIACLRAFSVCGGPNATLEVWGKIYRIWKLERRKVQDIIAVKAVLNRLTSENSRK